MSLRILFFLLISFSLHAGVPVDVVFDIDLTIVTLINDGPGGDLLKDPANPHKNVVKINFEHPELDEFNRPNAGKLIAKSERYRVFEGVRDLMEKLKAQQLAGKVRISFFSGGYEARNEALLKAIKLSDGTSLWDLSQGRSFGRTSLTPTGIAPPARIRERFKKDLTRVNPDLKDVIIIDDIKEFVPDSQKANMLWIGEDFPFPDRVNSPPLVLDPILLERERNKYKWISEKLDEALELRFSTGRALSTIVQDLTENNRMTPFNPRVSGCNVYTILNRLLAH